MTRKAEPVSEREGYTIWEVSQIAPDGSVLRSWVEVSCPNGDRKLCRGVEDAEAFIAAKIAGP